MDPALSTTMATPARSGPTDAATGVAQERTGSPMPASSRPAKERRASISRVPSAQDLPDDPNTWNAGEVKRWLVEQGLAEFCEIFYANGIEGNTILKLTADDFPDQQDADKLGAALDQLQRHASALREADVHGESAGGSSSTGSLDEPRVLHGPSAPYAPLQTVHAPYATQVIRNDATYASVTDVGDGHVTGTTRQPPRLPPQLPRRQTAAAAIYRHQGERIGGAACVESDSEDDDEYSRPPSVNQRAVLRDTIKETLIATEQKHIQIIEALLTYKDSIYSSRRPPQLKLDDIDDVVHVFSCIDELKPVHKSIYEKLRAGKQPVGKIMEKVSTALLAYATTVHDFLLRFSSWKILWRKKRPNTKKSGSSWNRSGRKARCPNSHSKTCCLNASQGCHFIQNI